MGKSPSFGALGFLLCVFLTPASLHAGPGDPIDFRRLDTAPETPPADRRRIIGGEKTIRSFNRDITQFETAMLSGRLLWAASDEDHLYFARGAEGLGQLVRSGLRVELDGRIVSLDLHTMSHLPDTVLLSVVHRSVRQMGDRILTTLYAVETSGEQLRVDSYYRTHDRVVRLIGDRFFAQGFDAPDMWRRKIYRLKSTDSGYEVETELNRPDDTRLLSTSALPGGLWAQLLSRGDLVLSRGDRTVARREGNFGLRPFELTSRSKHARSEPVRVPPVYLPNHEQIAVVRNPPDPGLFGLLSENGGESYLKLFEVQPPSLDEVALIGPFPTRFLDVEVSEANRDQLLWLRRRKGGGSILQVVDLSRRFEDQPSFR